jgi:hypothetical protein
MLEDAIESFLCGLGEDFKKNVSRKNAEKWIFKSKGFQFGFDEVWQMFFDHDPGIIKKALVKRYEKRLRDFKRKGRCVDAKNKSPYRRRRTAPCDINTYQGSCSVLRELLGQCQSIVGGQSLSGCPDDDGERGVWK